MTRDAETEAIEKDLKLIVVTAHQEGNVFRTRVVARIPLIEMVHDVKLSNLPDSWRWFLEKSGKFTFKSFRSRIEKQIFQSSNHFTRWSKLVPKKVNIMVWRAGRDRLETRVNLDSRNIDLHTGAELFKMLRSCLILNGMGYVEKPKSQ
ncbi:RNA-directed DNA polymerase, eukaryota, reverse transcriptase zinc-binding domain protein, partial [Tanacetum coccineum]